MSWLDGVVRFLELLSRLLRAVDEIAELWQEWFGQGPSPA